MELYGTKVNINIITIFLSFDTSDYDWFFNIKVKQMHFGIVIVMIVHFLNWLVNGEEFGQEIQEQIQISHLVLFNFQHGKQMICHQIFQWSDGIKHTRLATHQILYYRQVVFAVYYMFSFFTEIILAECIHGSIIRYIWWRIWDTSQK